MTTMSPFTNQQIGETDAWNPQAIFSRPINSFRRDGLVYHEGIDGLDFYRGVFGWIDGLPVAVKEHPGNPKIGDGPDRLVHLYLSDKIDDINFINAYVEIAARWFGVTPDDIIWQRKDGL